VENLSKEAKGPFCANCGEQVGRVYMVVSFKVTGGSSLFSSSSSSGSFNYCSDGCVKTHFLKALPRFRNGEKK